MLQPTYIVDPNIPETPRSFGLNVNAEGTVKLVVSADESVDNYNLYVSQDGLNFSLYNSFNSNEIILDGFEEYSILYVKLNAQNDHGASIDSEVLAVTPSFNPESHVLIINGFDRTSEGNTFNFVRQHGSALFKSNVSFSSATNDALTAGLFEMTDYKLVDYILGEESTADETFSYSEQQLVKDFLESGGRLFVSGSEIAWDIDYKGNSTDKSFMRDYLKARYSADAPGGIGGTYYSAEGLPDGIFSGIGDIVFDNGTHGSFDVDWADALSPEEGAVSIAKYKNVSSHDIGGISYKGIFGESEIPGKLVYIGFPFETIYPEQTRNAVMSAVLNYLSSEITSTEGVYLGSLDKYSISQNYPNPFNPTTKISFSIPKRNNVQIKIFDILGREISTLINEEKPAGTFEVSLDGSSLSSGVYFYQIKSGRYSDIKKMMLIK